MANRRSKSVDEKQEPDAKNLFVELAKIKTDLCWVKKNLSNHLRHHWAVQIVLLTFIGGLIAALVISLV